MKKISFVLALVMLISTLSLSAFAADTATVAISSASAKAGEEVTLTVAIQNSPGIAGVQLYIGYDSDVMTYVSAKATNSSFYTSVSDDEGTNPVKVVMANLSLKNIEGEISVAEIKCKIADNAATGEYDVSVSAVEAYDKDIAPVAVNIQNGTVTVEGKSASTSTPSTGTTHKHKYTTTVVEPNGTQPGYTLYECSCGHSYKGNYVYGDSTDVTASKFSKVRDYTDSFVDVTTEKWFYDYVKTAYEYSLANGTSATKFSPDNKFTVAQAITAAVNIHTTYYGTSVRAAAEGEAWYVPYVEYCTQQGIIVEGQFENYDANITRGDMAIVFANILPDSEYEAVRSVAPSDVVEESNVYPAYKMLYEAGIVSGDAGTGNFRPDEEIVRSEACVIFTRIAVVDRRAK